MIKLERRIKANYGMPGGYLIEVWALVDGEEFYLGRAPVDGQGTAQA